MPNAFIPIKPIPDKSSGYQNFLNWLGNVGAFSNMANSVMYRHVPDPKVSVGYPEEQSYPEGQRLGKLKSNLSDFMENGPQKENLLKAEPMLKKTTVRNRAMPDADASFNISNIQNLNGERGSRIFVGDHINNVRYNEELLRHEGLGHAASEVRPMQKTGPHPDYFDNKTGKIHNFDEFYNSSDMYKRATPEIIAESNIANDKTLSTRNASKGILAVPPSEQVHPIYKNFMQNLSKLGKVIPAITTPLQIKQTGDLYDNIRQKGPVGGYADWLGLQTNNPTKDYL